MEQTSMSAYKAQVEKYGTPISAEEYKELRDFANAHKIRLSGFKDFVGDITTIKTLIDDIVEISHDFPLILDERHGIVLELDYDLDDDDLATTKGHTIHLNAGHFSHLTRLTELYDSLVSKGLYVKGTNWRAISRHETGHVVANLLHIDPMEIAMKVLNVKYRAQVDAYLMKNLSLYSVEHRDGREIISESFSAHYSRVGNAFADEFVRKVGECI